MGIYYIYKVTNKVTNQFYFGSRTAQVMKTRTPQEDLWVHYFTSSKVIKQQIELYGKEAFTAEVLHTYDDPATTWRHEQIYIYYHSKNSNCINRFFHNPHNHKKTFLTSVGYKRNPNIPAWNKGKKMPPLSETHKEAIKKARTGKALSDSTRKKISLAHIGKPKSEEHKKKISECQRGKERKPLSAETRKKISLAHIGKPKTYPAWNKGQKTNAESIKKMLASRKQYWDNKHSNTK